MLNKLSYRAIYNRFNKYIMPGIKKQGNITS